MKMLLTYEILVLIFIYGSKIFSGALEIEGPAKNGTVIANVVPFYKIKLFKAKRDRYYFIGASMAGNWFESWRFCSEHSMNMFSIESNSDVEVFEDILYKSIVRLDGHYWFWTSGVNWHNNHKWVWASTGNDISIDMWKNSSEKQKNAAKNLYDHCLSVGYRPAKQPSTAWYSRNCYQFRAFPVCETILHTSDARTNGKTAFWTKFMPGMVLELPARFISLGIAFLLMDIVEALLGTSCNGWIYLFTLQLLCTQQS